jgi:hypothetical protein
LEASVGTAKIRSHVESWRVIEDTLIVYPQNPALSLEKGWNDYEKMQTAEINLKEYVVKKNLRLLAAQCGG